MTLIQLLKVISYFELLSVQVWALRCNLKEFGRDNKLVNGLELIRMCKCTRFPGISIWNFGMGNTGQPFLNSRSFWKISIGKNQNGAFHLHSKPNFRKFCVNNKQPRRPGFESRLSTTPSWSRSYAANAQLSD